MIAQWQRVILAQLHFVLDRFESNPTYGLIDTKFDVISGQNVPSGDPNRGKGIIFGWIQGRGLEALAGHARWLSASPSIELVDREKLIQRIRAVMQILLDRLDQMRSHNHGRLAFMMDIKGKPLGIPVENEQADASNFSDLFFAKGMATAADFLGDNRRFSEAKAMFNRVCDDIEYLRFVSDQVSLDPLNPVAPIPGRLSHGPHMIALGGLSLMLQLTGDARYRDIGFTFIDHILSRHVNVSYLPFNAKTPCKKMCASLMPDVMWEFTDTKGNPWYEEQGILRSDPGHANEFVGLALKLLDVCQGCQLITAGHQSSIQCWREILCRMLHRHVLLGFNTNDCGIYKAINLLNGQPLHHDMPWWPLPETLRAAAYARAVVSSESGAAYEAIIKRCSEAFLHQFVQEDRGLLAYQTLDAAGLPVSRIPATPDLDPCYHTGLSLIDAIMAL